MSVTSEAFLRFPMPFAILALASWFAMTLAALSLSGIPLLGGYVSKTMLEEAAFHAHFAPLAQPRDKRVEVDSFAARERTLRQPAPLVSGQ